MKKLRKAPSALAAVLLGWLVCASPALALRLESQARGDADVLTFAFDSTPPSFSVSRSGAQEITVSLGADPWKAESRPSGAGGGRLVSGVEPGASGLRIRLNTNAFGYVTANRPGGFQITVFRDPLGARWGRERTAAAVESPAPVPAEPRKAEPAPKAKTREQAKPKAEVKPKAEAKPKTEAKAKVEAKPKADPVRREAASTPAQPAAQAAPVAAEPRRAAEKAPAGPVVVQPSKRGSAPAVETELPMPGAAGDAAPGQEPYFSVPYSVRTQLGPGDPGGNGTVGQMLPAPEAREVPVGPDGEVRFKAVSKGPEEVRLAELAGGSLPVQPVGNGFGEVKGQASGGVLPPVPAAESSAEVPMPDMSSVPTGPVLPAPPAAPKAPSQAKAEAPVEPPPPVNVVPGAPEAAPQAPPVEPPKPEPAHAELPPSDNATAAAPEGNATAGELAGSERETYLRETLYTAEGQMANGDLKGAKESLQGLLAAPDLPVDVREDALYDMADTVYQMYRDSIRDHFPEISKAYNEAMNANLNSPRVPAALLNLGLLNLKVDNVPEATAYFNLLKKKYPEDTNVPYIDYYWGEYAFNKGNYAEAARRLQTLIQQHPDIPIIKQASYLLANSLHLLGYNEQAFQITDYMDKRWPLLYMENPRFLKLAADVENSLGKLKEAKDHYWTYYNLNPQAQLNDIVLARVADIYLRDGRKKAAKDIYDKVIKDYPDAEGALVAKMRLAEEGIYDDPTEPVMASVFDRPYNVRPRDTYIEIAEKHPDSPLAPLALLKLAMWNAWNKQYGDALGAVQDLLDRYPKSELVPKARELGDKTFTLAVPQLIADQNYGRVAQWWEKYKFVDQGKVDDDTRLGVATCYWKTGEHDKALGLIRRYLTKNQVPKYSEMALNLASNIFLETGAWTRLDELAAMARRNWKIPRNLEQQLDYARAMSLENLNEPKKSLPIWAQLAADVTVDANARANAMYYLAKASMEKQDLRRVFAYSQEALSLLLQTKGDKDKIKDAILMTVFATEHSGRYEEALKWASEYDKYIPESDPEWASMHFRLANIYRKAGAVDEWRRIMTDIQTKKPDSLYGRMAASAIETQALEQKAREYAPVPN
ncbi:tetratricopeptide repeat protein [Desulfovibrio aminophilus]|uniref:tetratricopeptide repeat protein n=1 Tax=Desulfovibrio aminophilus TaxID=81425 RepID=UPI000A03643E|nr:tetratricopeptide repeat protein [Desulfovibrio aminophilus]